MKWISVNMALPEIDKLMLCCSPSKELFIGYYHGGTYKKGIVTFWDPTRKCGCGVTYWMPLPEPPKEDTTLEGGQDHA